MAYRMDTRLDKLERTYAHRLRPCPVCHGLAPRHGSGEFTPGILVEQPGNTGRHYCFCKWCGNTFTAALTPLTPGRYLARDIAPTNWPMPDPPYEAATPA